MEGEAGSSFMLLFQKYFNFSSSTCRYLFKQDLMRRCHVNWNCLILPCVDTKGDDGAEIFRLQPTTAAFVPPSLHQQPLPGAFWGEGVLPAACFLPMDGELGISSTKVLFTCCSHRIGADFAQCLSPYLCATAGVGLKHPELPPNLGRAAWWERLVTAGLECDCHQEELPGHLLGVAVDSALSRMI